MYALLLLLILIGAKPDLHGSTSRCQDTVVKAQRQSGAEHGYLNCPTCTSPNSPIQDPNHTIRPYLLHMAHAIRTRSFLRPIISYTAVGFSSRTASRTMASALAKTDWLVILPDIEGALAKRMEVRPYECLSSMFIADFTLFEIV
jgi:hypothetical protein